MRFRFSPLVSALLFCVVASTAQSQQPVGGAAASAAGALPMPAAGDLAPDFEIRGATRYGLLRDRMRLSDFKGQTVVLWLFIKARTRG